MRLTMEQEIYNAIVDGKFNVIYYPENSTDLENNKKILDENNISYHEEIDVRGDRYIFFEIDYYNPYFKGIQEIIWKNQFKRG